MNILTKVSWKKHLLSLLTLFVMTVAFGVSLVFHLNTQNDLELAQAAYRNQRNINQDARNSLELIDSYINEYNKIKEIGLIGDAQRLQWLEITQAITDQLDILLVDFTLNSTFIADESTSNYFNEELKLSLTPMTFELQLRHEGEFYSFMEGLRSNAKGKFTINECNIIRNPSTDNENPEYSGMKARCYMNWFSLDDISKRWELAAQ